MRQSTVCIFLMGILVAPSYSQEIWSLPRCVEFALENSIALENSKLNVTDAEISANLAWQQRLPQLDGSSGYNLSFGRSIDPSTNDFISQQFGNQTISVSGGVLLWNGGQVNSLIKQARTNQEAAVLDLKQLKNDISLQVASTYLNILFAREREANARKSVELTRSQLDQIEKLIAAGSRPRNASLELVAQIATGEQAVITAQNDGVLAKLDLKQLIQLDPDVDFDIEVPALSVPTDYEIAELNAANIYRIAVQNQPNIQAGELRARNAELGVSLAKTNFYPSLTIGGSLGSNFSSVAARRGDPTGIVFSPIPAKLSGENVNFELGQPAFDFDKIGYFDQINQNFGYGLGLSLNVPIFRQGSNKLTLERAKIDVRRNQVANQDLKNTLRSTIARSVTDVRTSKLQYEAALRTLEASSASYSDTQKRFDLGVTNSFELTTAINNRDRAEVDVLIAKYDFIFKTKVLDFYQGKPIILD